MKQLYILQLERSDIRSSFTKTAKFRISCVFEIYIYMNGIHKLKVLAATARVEAAAGRRGRHGRGERGRRGHANGGGNMRGGGLGARRRQLPPGAVWNVFQGLSRERLVIENQPPALTVRYSTAPVHRWLNVEEDDEEEDERKAAQIGGE